MVVFTVQVKHKPNKKDWAYFARCFGDKISIWLNKTAYLAAFCEFGMFINMLIFRKAEVSAKITSKKG